MSKVKIYRLKICVTSSFRPEFWDIIYVMSVSLHIIWNVLFIIQAVIYVV
jgi:hypothetical protein